jgi:hypothetical protein
MCSSLAHFFVLVGLFLRSAASRFSVRFFAAASEAFFALAERSSGVIVSRLRLPPILPPLLPISRMISLKSALVFLSIASIA